MTSLTSAGCGLSMVASHEPLLTDRQRNLIITTSVKKNIKVFDNIVKLHVHRIKHEKKYRT